ncbi:MAG: adenylosuccinate synthase [Candidatus Marinimicrobia bacterium]|nr:adenylosuccinate synthase [Candidatus Neomarinimicrobiota bacterium]
MPVTAVIGGQWGDEGKGKMVDSLSADADIVARYQGGANAGHTVIIGDKTFILHQIPSGILHEKVRCVLGHGMVVDPVSLIEEIDSLHGNGIDTAGRILLSTHAHIVTPLHKAMDRATGQVIGTTGRGIGLAYSDKARRLGIRAVDLIDVRSLGDYILKRLKLAIDQGEISEAELPTLKGDIEQFLQASNKVLEYLTDTVSVMLEAIANGDNILIEGAQGTLLDVDLGTYPYVTSSSSSAAGIAAGLGIPARSIDRLVGIFKAYTTRVGNGPFPTELQDKTGEQLQNSGAEFGATTGRPRRCGWFDAVSARYACRTNGIDEIYLSKLDVLEKFDRLKICTGYRWNGEVITDFSAAVHNLDKVEPIYEELPGWDATLSQLTDANDLPEQAKAYIARIEELLEVPVSQVSIGAERSQILKR